MFKERSPGLKLLFVGFIGTALIVPLIMVFWLVSDRQHQARVAQQSITAGWAGAQVVAGPILVLPYNVTRETSEIVEGKTVTRSRTVRELLYLNPISQRIDAGLEPEVRSRGIIHQSVVYEADLTGSATFELPEELARLGIERDQLRLDEAWVQLPIADQRGLRPKAYLRAGGEELDLSPGLGSNQTGGGIHAFLDWTESETLNLEFGYSLRGSSAFSFVPRGEETTFNASSSWQHPSFTGAFLPGDDGKEVGPEGFRANWSISNLALGQAMVNTNAPTLPYVAGDPAEAHYFEEASGGEASVATIRLMEPVDLYKRVERSLKYGFLFIGFTFLAFLMFDIVAGARVASAEYLLTGAGLILFFVMLLAFAEMIGFAAAYFVASAAIIGLLTTYSAAVLGSWKRAGVIGGLLVGLYAVLYVLLNLEAWSLVIGSLMLFVALAGVMYATRKIDWAQVGGSDAPPPDQIEEEAIPATPA